MSTHPNKAIQKQPAHKETKQRTASKSEHPIDSRLRILRDEILPAVPYILSTYTSLTPEHVKVQYPQNEINWRKYTLFNRGEDELQYLTFKDRSSDHDIRGMYARGGWDDGKGRIAPLEEPYSRTSSDGTPRQGQASKKKKITLADYKNREKTKASQPIATAAVAAIAPGPKDGVKDLAGEAHHTTDNGSKAKTQPLGPHGQKRSAETMIGTQESQSIAHTPTSPPSKKARVTPEPSTAPSKGLPDLSRGQKADPNTLAVGADTNERPGQRAEMAKSTPHTTPVKSKPSNPNTQPAKSPIPRLPPMLSPLSSDSVLPRLPPMLSPLSSDIEKELAKLETLKPEISLDSTSVITSTADRADTAKGNKTAKLAAAEKLTASTKLPKSSPSTKGPQEQKQPTSESRQIVENATPNKYTPPKPASNGLPNGNKGASIPTPKTTPEGPKKIRLRIAIPIKRKANRKNLATYLRMKPTPGRNSLFPNRPLEQQNLRSGTSTCETTSFDKSTYRREDKPEVTGKSKLAIEPETPKIGEKRGRTMYEADAKDESPSKPKPTGRIPQGQKIHTPKALPTSSPATSHLGSAQKPPTSTPKAEMNGNAMVRASSGQGSVHTPQAPHVNGTPDTGRRYRSYASPDKPISPNTEDLGPESKKYMATAVALKHDADVFMKKHEMTDDGRKRGIVIGTESVLCFMTAFSLADTCRVHSDRGAWKSILPYLTTLQEAARIGELKHMHGLLSQLEGIIRDQIAYVDMQLLDNNPFRHDTGNAAVDPSKAKERKAEEYFKQCQDFHGHFMKAQSAWRSGWQMLDVLDVQAHYPRTWDKRDTRRLAYGKGKEAISKGQYIRGYNLPMNNMTSGLEAVSFGMNFIKEWSRATGVEWQPKLVLRALPVQL